jgi:hypothetical protein
VRMTGRPYVTRVLTNGLVRHARGERHQP